MPEYCITFLHIPEGSTDEALDDPVFYTHVTAAVDITAVEGALHEALAQNVSLKRANAVALRVLLPLEAGVVKILETLRVATHGATPLPRYQSTPQVRTCTSPPEGQIHRKVGFWGSPYTHP